MKTPPRPVVRRAARVLLIDPDERVLLILGGDPAAPAAGTWWITPGGGLEAGEDARAAAIREVREETGHRLPDLGEPVLHRSAVFPFDGRLIEQREVWFAARVPAFEPQRTGWTELEQQALHAFAWWSVDELRATEEVVFPDGLADLVERTLRA